MHTIGQKLREARLVRGLTQADLSSDLVTPSMISQIESDKANPSFTLLTAISNRLGLPVEYFINDLEEQFTLQSYLRQAEYHLLLHRPQEALTTLQKTIPLELHGTTMQHTMLLRVWALRLLERYEEAVQLLETIREYALRTKDASMQCTVHRESGHLEYAMNNPLGAIQEWSMAIDIGEKLLGSDPTNVPLSADLTRLCLHQYDVLRSLRQFAEAEPFLFMAERLSHGFRHLRNIADAVTEAAQFALLHGRPSQAKTMMDKAIAIVQSARLVEQRILIRVRIEALQQAKQDDETAPTEPFTDPLLEAALATVTMDPSPFVEAELTRIEQALTNREIEPARSRIERCLAILHDYCAEFPELERPTKQQEYRLRLGQAKIEYLAGRPHNAISLAEDICREIMTLDDSTATASWQLLTVLAQLLQWYSESGLETKAWEISDQINQLMQEIQPYLIGSTSS